MCPAEPNVYSARFPGRGVLFSPTDCSCFLGARLSSFQGSFILSPSHSIVQEEEAEAAQAPAVKNREVRNSCLAEEGAAAYSEHDSISLPGLCFHWRTCTADRRYHTAVEPHIHNTGPHRRLKQCQREARLQRRSALHPLRYLKQPQWPLQDLLQQQCRSRHLRLCFD